MEPNVVILRARGVGRFFEAAFLGVWLCGWIAGEAFALAGLGSILLALFGVLPDSRITEFGRTNQDAAAVALLFLTIWLTFWTFGGIAAWWIFFRRLVGVDRIHIDGSAIEALRQAGPIRRRRRIERMDIRRIRTQPRDGSLVADTTSGTHVLSDLGTPPERDALVSWIKSQLHLSDVVPDPATVPPGWTLEPPDESGAPRLTRPRGGRMIVGAAMWTVTAVIAYAVVRGGSANPGWTSLIVLLLAFAATWVCWAHEAWIVRHHRLDYRLQLGPFLRMRTFEHGCLELSHTIDSDGDSRYKLLVRDASGKKVVDSALHDDTELRDLARWLASATKMTVKTGCQTVNT